MKQRHLLQSVLTFVVLTAFMALAPGAANAQTGNISFADANVKALCVATSTGWDSNSDGELSYDEAAAVTSLKPSGATYCLFKNNTTITSFNELQYFTGLTSLESDAFNGCTNLASVTLPNTVTTIYNHAFDACTRLNFIILPSSVTKINPYAFYNCSGLNTIIIKGQVTNIGNYAFRGCTGLTSITVYATTPPTLAANGPLQNVPTDIPVYVPCGKKTTYQNSSGWNSFTNYHELCETISFADANVKALCVANWDSNSDGELSYAEAAAVTSLETVFKSNTTITSFNELQYFMGLTSIITNAFYGCTGLTSVTIPTSVTSIANYAFKYCTHLTSITFPNSVTSIGTEAFYNCAQLGSVSFGNSLRTIGNNAFNSCYSLTSIEIPSSVTTITNNPFSGCRAVTQITVEAGNNYFDSRDGCNAIIKTSSNQLVAGCRNTVIPEGITSIGTSAFYYQTSLSAITIPSSVADIYSFAFDQCTGLTSLTVMASTPPTLGTNALRGVTTSIPVYVPVGSVSAYQTTSNWSNFTNIVGFISFVNPAVETICLQNWDTDQNGVLSLTEAAAVESLGTVFKSNTTITSFNELQYFTGLRSINSEAFSSCSGLESITLPNSVTSIGSSAFLNCGNLNSIPIGNGLTNIGQYAFAGCCNVTSLVIPSSIVSIGFHAFSSESMTSITVDANNDFYDSRNGCNAIIETATNTLILGCINTTIPDNVTSIGLYAFLGCTMTSIVIPNSVTSIGTNAFFFCDALTSMTVLATTPPVLGTNVFYDVPTDIPVYVPCGSLEAYQNYNNTGEPWGGFTNFIGSVTIGTGTSGAATYPITMERDYSVTQMVYPASDVYNAPCAIQSIAYYYNGSDAFSMDGIQLYLKNITMRYFYSLNYMVQVEESDRVFSGTFNVTGNGWNTITFDKPFYYDGTSALLVCFYDPTAGYPGTKLFRYTDCPGDYRSCSIFDNDVCPDINNLSSWGSGNTFDRQPFVPNIRLTMNTNIDFDDDDVKALCVANWDTNQDGELSYAEAAAVTSLGTVFKNNQTITSFDELQYFTGLTSIETNAFMGCTNLASVTLPDNITSIGNWAFSYCSSLSQLIIPNNVNTIWYQAFSGTALTSIVIPASVTSIGYTGFSTRYISIFTHCNALESITVAEGNTVYDSRDNCNAIIETATNTLISGCKNTIIPSTVNILGEAVFMGITSLNSITIPASVTSIDLDAFYDCNNMAEMTLLATTPPTLGSNSVFYNVPTDIPVYVPCGSLEAYQNYDNGSPWGGFTNIQTTTNILPWTEDFESYAGAIGNYENSLPDCWSRINTTTAWTGFPSIRAGQEDAHTGDKYLDFQSVVGFDPQDLYAILPYIEDVKRVRLDFYARTDDYIDDMSGELIVGVMTDPTDANTFVPVFDRESLPATYEHIVVDIIENYTGNGHYIAFMMPAANNSSTLHHRHLVYLDDLTVEDMSGQPIQFDDASVKALCVANWDTNQDGELSYAEAAAVTSLGTVFQNAFQTQGTSVTFDELQYFTGLTSINDNAFSGCWRLSSITLPSSVTTIEYNAFMMCADLSSITIPSSVTSIGHWVFSYCQNLTAIELPDGLTSIGARAFDACTGLTSIVIPASVTSIEVNPFTNCDNLASITVAAGNTVYSSPNNNAIVETATHTLITGLSSTVIPNDIQTISQFAFASCTGLTSIVIPASVTNINTNAFEECTNLAQMTVLADTPPTIVNSTFINVPTDIPVYVPYESYEAYQTYDNGSPWGGFTNIIGQPYSAFPYVNDFETSCGWQLINGELTNQWAWGEAGTRNNHHLYISDNSGVSCNYDNTSSAMVYATKRFHFEEGWYRFQYDWLANGEKNWDYLRVALVPASVTLSAGTSAPSVPSGSFYNNLPSGWIALDGGSQLGLNSWWQTNHCEIEVPTGDYMMVFAWRNDGSVGTQPPADIDNVSVRAVTCPAPTDLAVQHLGATKVTLDWTPVGDEEAWTVSISYDNGNETVYLQYPADTHPFTATGLPTGTECTAKVFAVCGTDNSSFSSNVISFTTSTNICDDPITFPFTEGFENYVGYTNGSQNYNVMPSCWNYINGNTDPSYVYYPTIHTYPTYAHDESNNYLLFAENYDANYTQTGQYVILPEMDNVANLVVSLYARTDNNHRTAYFEVGVMTDPADASTFTSVASCEPTSTDYTYYTFPLGLYYGEGHYIAIRMPAASPTTQYRCVCIDDISVTENTCAAPTGLTLVDIFLDSFMGPSPNGNFGASFSWDAEASDVFQYCYLLAGQTPTDESFDNEVTGGNGCIFGYLFAPGNRYTFYLRKKCSDNVFSGPVSITFDLPCMPITYFPLTEGFESYTGTTTFTENILPNCWSRINTTTDSPYLAYPTIGTNSGETFSYNGNNYLYFLSGYMSGPNISYDNPQDQYAILPEIENVNSTVLSFYARRPYEGNDATFMVGVMTDPTDANTFTEVASFSPESTTYSPYTIPFGLYFGSGTYIAIKLPAASTETNYRGVCIDDISVTENDCAAPTGLTVSNIRFWTLRWGALFTWDVEEGDVFEYCYTSASAIPNETTIWNETQSSFVSYSDAFFPGNSYTFYLRKKCGDNLFSAPVSVTFYIPCAIGGESYEENFDSYIGTTSPGTVNVLPECWSRINYTTDESFTGYPTITNYSYANSSPNFLYFMSSYIAGSYDNPQDQYAILPEIENVKSAVMTLNARHIDGGRNATFMVGVMTDPTDPYTFTEMATFTPTSTSYTEYTVRFASYTGYGSTYIAIKMPAASSEVEYRGLCIDDLSVTVDPVCAAPTDVQVVSNGVYPGTGTLGFTFSFTPGHEDQELWTYYISTDPVLPTLQQMGANGWMGDIDHTEHAYYPTGDDALEHNTAYYIWVGYDCGTNEYIWSEWPAMVTTVTDYEYTLSAGINWWTPVAEMTVEELEIALDNINTGDILINSQKDGFLRREGGQWNGTLDESATIYPGLMLKIWTESGGTFWHLCVPQTWGDSEIVQGWNWIGCISATSLGQTFGNFMAEEGDKIVDQDGHTVTFTNGAWTGDTNMPLVHGKGYLYYSTSENTKIISF